MIKAALFYSPQAFSTAQFSKTPNWGRFLTFNNCTTDYMYNVLKQASAYPSYRPRMLILTPIYVFLTNMGMPSNSNYVLKSFHSIQPSSITSWLKNSIKGIGAINHHYQNSIRTRSRIVTVPNESWNLRLVNIQKMIKNHAWKLTLGTGSTIAPSAKAMWILLSDPARTSTTRRRRGVVCF